MAKREKPWRETIAAERWKSIPSAIAYRFLWHSRPYRYLSRNQPELAVLVDAKAEKRKLDDDLVALMEQVQQATWDQLRQRVTGVYYPDEVAEKLGLPLWERIEELNDDSMHSDARAAAIDAGIDEDDDNFYDSDEYQKALERAQTELFSTWQGAIESAFSGPLDQISMIVGDEIGKFTFWPADDHWKRTGEDMFEQFFDINVRAGSADEEKKEALEKYKGPVSWKEFVFFNLDVEFWMNSNLFDRREMRRYYDESFSR